MKRGKMPIVLSHDTRTGLVIYPNRKMGGRDMVIVGLNKEVKSGDSFDWRDIEWTKAVLHFADVKTMEIMADALAKAAR